MGGIERRDFFGLLEAAVGLAQAASFPVLMLVELPGLTSVQRQFGTSALDAMILAAAERLADALGDHAFVAPLRPSRLAALVASDGMASLEALSTRALASFARPVIADGRSLASVVLLATAQWGRDGETAEALFVAADQQLHAAGQSSSAAATAAMPPVLSYRPSPLAQAG